MKKTFILLSFVLVLTSFQSYGDNIVDWIRGTTSTTFTKEITISPETHILISQNNRGNITILPSEKNKTIIIEETQHGKPEKTMEITTKVERKENNLLITIPENQNDIYATLYIPKNSALSVASQNGNIRVEQIDAPLIISTERGSIAIEGATKSINATTNNGTIDISYTHVTPGSSIVLETDSNITLTLPKGTAGNLIATTDGKIISDHFVTLAPITTKITAQTGKQILKNITGEIGGLIPTKNKKNSEQKNENKFVLRSTKKGKISLRES